VVALALLGAEVAVLDHAGELDDALQLHLAPAAAHVRRAERGDEVARLGAKPLLPVGNCAQLLADRRDGAEPALLELARLALEALQGLLDRREARLGQLEQRRLVLREGVPGHGLEPLLPLLLRALEQLDALIGRRPLTLDSARTGSECRARPEVHGACAERQ